MRVADLLWASWVPPCCAACQFCGEDGVYPKVVDLAGSAGRRGNLLCC